MLVTSPESHLRNAPLALMGRCALHLQVWSLGRELNPRPSPYQGDAVQCRLHIYQAEPPRHNWGPVLDGVILITGKTPLDGVHLA